MIEMHNQPSSSLEHLSQDLRVLKQKHCQVSSQAGDLLGGFSALVFLASAYLLLKQLRTLILEGTPSWQLSAYIIYIIAVTKCLMKCN